jgi:hypothetical protein
VWWSVPVAGEAELWAHDPPARFSEPPADDELDLSVIFDPERLEEVGGLVASAGDGSRFELEIDAGRYLVCLHSERADPVAVQGCQRVDLAPGDVIVVSRGEEGTLVRSADEWRRFWGL